MKFVGITADNYAAVAAIYQQGIDTGIATFETTVPAFSKWDQTHQPFGRIALMDNDQMLGWASLSKVSDRCVYGGVAEVSIYVAAEARGRGAGKKLLQQLILESEAHGIWTLQCGIMRDNRASIALHEKCGFRQIGYRERVGCLHGKWLDNVLMERRSLKVGID